MASDLYVCKARTVKRLKSGLLNISLKHGKCLKCGIKINNYGYCRQHQIEIDKRLNQIMTKRLNQKENNDNFDDHYYNDFRNLPKPDYHQFLADKRIVFKASGFRIEDDQLWSGLFPHQKALTKYALRKGKAAILAAVGLGKTLMLWNWSKIVSEHTNKPVLIMAPLYVAYQTIDMIKDLTGYEIEYIFNPDEATENKVYITNYERLHNFITVNPAEFWGGIAADESSIFKGMDSKTFQLALKVSKGVSYKSCYSATPSPNSIEEIGKQCEFLEIMTQSDMKATFFTMDRDARINGKQKNEWGIAPHAQEKFYRWLASWAMALNKPSDLGFSDEGYNLPPFEEILITVPSGYVPDGQLFFTNLKGVSDRSQVRQKTLEVRCQKGAEIVKEIEGQSLIWCGLNTEADRMKELLSDSSVNVQGSDSIESKIKNIRSFVHGETENLVSKTKICGLGSNFQNAVNVFWIGLSDSYEQFHQGNSRVYRFRQTQKVRCYVIISEEEIEIYDNIKRKQKQAIQMTEKLIKNADQYQKEELDGTSTGEFNYMTDDIKTKDYHIMLGDSIERIQEIENNSVGLSVYSPPFEDLFTYSPTERDLGNSGNRDDFYIHYGYLVEELLRITQPGRKTVVHCMDLHARKARDGYIGLKDFSGDLIRLYTSKGWLYQGRIPISKNPQSTAIRLKAHELMFATMKRDSARLMPVQPDYLLVFTKPGENKNPVLPLDSGEMDENAWIEWAGQTWNKDFPRLDELNEAEFVDEMKKLWNEMKNGLIWHGIKETEVLQFKGRNNQKLDENDTKHICPLQLDTVERAIKLWSNPGDTIFTPFMGIGTEVYQAIKFGRHGIGIELKPEYFYKAAENVNEAVRLSKQDDLFSLMGIEV